MSYEYQEPFYGIFELAGLKIQSTTDRDKFVFEDAMILNGTELKSFFKKNYSPNIHNSDMNNYFDHHFVKSMCYLVVKSYEDGFDKIKKRADEIAAFISLVSLINSNFRECISLSDQIFESHSNSIHYLDNNGFTKSRTYQYIYGLGIRVSEIITTRKTLKQIYNSYLYNNLFKLINSNSPKFSRKIKDAIVVLYKHYNAQGASINFLGTIITVEMLFKQGQEKYQNIKNRLKVLLSEDVYNFYNHYINLKENEDRDLFEIRNNFVHGGVEIHKDNALKALMFISLVILSLSNLVEQKELKKQSEVLSFLDESFAKSNFKHYDNLIDINANKFTKNFLSVIFILNYITPKYKKIKDKIKLKQVKQEDFKLRVKVLELNNGLSELEAFNMVNTLSLDMRNTFTSFNYFKEFDIEITDNANNLINQMNKYTHPIFFHEYDKEVQLEQK